MVKKVKKRNLKDNEREDQLIKITLEVKRFVWHHKRRVKLLKKLLKETGDGGLIFQICVLGFESLARVIYPNEVFSDGRRDTKSGFVKLLSKIMKRKDAIRFYDLYRNQIIHEGFLPPFSFIESDNENKDFVYTYEKYLYTDLTGYVDYPPETLISIYEILTHYADYYFKKKRIKFRILKDVKVYRIPKEVKEIERKRRKYSKV